MNGPHKREEFISMIKQSKVNDIIDVPVFNNGEGLKYKIGFRDGILHAIKTLKNSNIHDKPHLMEVLYEHQKLCK